MRGWGGMKVHRKADRADRAEGLELLRNFESLDR